MSLQGHIDKSNSCCKKIENIEKKIIYKNKNQSIPLYFHCEKECWNKNQANYHK